MSGTLVPQVQPQNPFAQLGQTVQGINALRGYQAQQATADAYGQAIDPNTGALDQGKFNALMASTPQGRWNIGPNMQQAGQAQTAQGQGTVAQVAAARAQLSGISAYLQPLFQQTMGPNAKPVTGQQVLDTLNQMPSGLATPEMVANVKNQVASVGGPSGDATNLVRGAQFATMTGEEQLKTLYPPTLPVNLGATVQPYQPSPLAVQGGAGFTGGGKGAPTSMSPGDANTSVDIQIGGGQVITTTKGVAAPMLANNPWLAKLNPNFGATSGAVTNQSFGPNQGRYTPPASSTTTPAGGSGTTPPAPSSTGPYVIGDSVGLGIRSAGKFDGNTTVGASPQAVLATINDPKNPLPVQGRDVVLANGSNPGNLAMIPDQIAALKTQGANSVTVVGVANPQIDKQLQQYAQDAGVRYVPMGAAGPDGVHPTGQGYTSLAGSVAPPAQPAQPAQPTPRWAQPPPPVVQGGSAGGFGLTPAPGYVDSQRATAAASTQAQNTLQAQITASKDIEPILADMDAQTRTAGFSTGVGSTIASTVRQLAIRAGALPDTPGAGLDLSSPQAAQEEFAKDAARLQAAQLGAMGNPTDARQELSETTNPGMMLSKYGNQNIIHMLQGNQQAIRAQGAAWAQAQQAGWTPDRYNEWLTNSFMAPDPSSGGGRFDPRAFWIANIPTLAEQKAYIAKVPTAQQAQLRANVAFAQQSGWVKAGPDGRAVVALQ